MFSSCIVVTNLNIKPPSMQIVYNPDIFCTLIGRFMSHGLILVSFWKGLLYQPDVGAG